AGWNLPRRLRNLPDLCAQGGAAAWRLCHRSGPYRSTPTAARATPSVAELAEHSMIAGHSNRMLSCAPVMLDLRSPVRLARRVIRAAWLVGGVVHLLSAPSGACTCDCNGNGVVTVDELLHGVNIALGRLPLSSCTALDQNGDGKVTINELLSGVSFT